jgi:hypothetical protein
MADPERSAASFGESPPPDSSGSPPAARPGEGAAVSSAPSLSSSTLPAEGGSSGPFQRCLSLGLAEAQAAQLSKLDVHTLQTLAGHESQIALRSLVAFAALGRGNFALADAALALPGAPENPEQRLLDLSARLYRACVGAERDPEQPQRVMNALSEALLPVMGLASPEAQLARGYAGLTLSEALLRIGDVGAARQQLESVVDEPGMPVGIAVIAGLLLGGIEQAVSRPDLALGHVQVALHRATQLGVASDEERLLRLILVALLMADSRRLGPAMLDDVRGGKYGPPPSGYGTVARLFHLLQLIAQTPTEPEVLAATEPHVTLLRRFAIHSELRWLQGRHNSAGWSLLFTALCAGALSGMGDTCESYGVLIEAAAELRCRYMDGVADLCDRQIAVLRHQLGADAFEQLIAEAQRRRHELRIRQAAMAAERP